MYNFLRYSMYFCDISCIVCVYKCTEQLPPGGRSIAVKYISYHLQRNPSVELLSIHHSYLYHRCCTAPYSEASPLLKHAVLLFVMEHDANEKTLLELIV
jgi:hypothetical protein